MRNRGRSKNACTSRTLYTASLSQDATVALIVKGRGTHFDPAVVDALNKAVELLGVIAGKIGAKRSIFLALVVYTGISIIGS